MTGSSIRCAIYTRKSSDEGLEQEFNTLDAQYEACANYIASQRHEGWKLIKKQYDDGGISGGTLDRPALQQLLDDMDAGRIQMVVVYKIDRLTRSLTDFSKLVDRLDAANCSFVSVTQSFNTSTSMGRLTLNVLLSFAQFEREVTAERIRDKIAASKKKGLWMGGVCPIGYDKDPDPQSRTLVVNNEEARRVKILFELYEKLGWLRSVEREAETLGLRSKRRVYATGRVAGGKAFSRGQIYHVLRNPIYLGRIRHKETDYPGQHQAIIDKDLWERVQTKLTEASQRKRRSATSTNHSSKTADQSILMGKLFDETGDCLTPTYTTKNNRRFRYYVSKRLVSSGADSSGWRLSAPRLEEQIASIIAGHLETHTDRYVLTNTPDLHTSQSMKKNAIALIQKIRAKGMQAGIDLIVCIHLYSKTLQVRLNEKHLGKALGVDVAKLSKSLLQFEVSWCQKKRGVENKIIIGVPIPQPDQTLVRILWRAHEWVQDIKTGVAPGIIAKKHGVTTAYIRTRSRLAFLSPKIQQAIVTGTLDPKFTTRHIMGMKIPSDWQSQEALFGL